MKRPLQGGARTRPQGAPAVDDSRDRIVRKGEVRINGKRATVWSVPAFSFQDKGHQTPEFNSGSII